ncbi:MAG TPA: glycosyltransferase family 2 protein [Acidimicrobiales bacterium]|nr:glycosyltransferase family 2 protein [Acidimicrobiales bacterium]
MATKHGEPGTDPSAESPQSLAGALEWLADRLVEAIPQPEVVPEDLPWDVDAGSSPPSYWHWLHLRRAYRTAHADALPEAHLPIDGPLLSVVAPIYRPPTWYFRECVASVLNQSYQHWELCLCDDGSEDPELTGILEEYAASDSRIKVVTMDGNGGISRATNRALEAATGEFIVLLDHDDVLETDALAEIATVVIRDGDADVIYSDEDKLDELDRPFMPHFKPDWDPDLLLAYPYLGHVLAVRHELLDRIGRFRPDFDGSQDYDVMLRSTEVARRVVHIPKVLYHWRVVAGSAAGDTDAKPWAHLASRRALEDAVARRGLDAEVKPGPFQGAYHVRRRIHGSPTVSVIIPFRDQAALTMGCLDSLETSPGYEIGEVVLIDNGSMEPETRALCRQLEHRPSVRIINYPGAFNWAAINNVAAATCRSDMLLFLNNDIEASSNGWLRALVELGQRPDVGAVGARLVFPDGKLQHAGVVLGLGGIASHLFIGMPKDGRGYFSWDRVVRGYSAVTAACMLVRRSVFEELSGFDENFAVGFNDVDFCIRLRRAGYRVLYTPHAELTHFESVSRGLSGYYRDYQEFLARWNDLLGEEDPSYNPNLSRLVPWCPLRPPGEDEEWRSLVGGLIQPAQIVEEEATESLS